VDAGAACRLDPRHHYRKLSCHPLVRCAAASDSGHHLAGVVSETFDRLASLETISRFDDRAQIDWISRLMSAHLPTLKQLQYLVSLRRHEHFGKAADACFVTQSTLSAGLRELEELAELAGAEGQPLHGELRMGVIPTIAPFLLPTMLPRLRSEWPDLKL